jgi:hypothetical protein
MPIGIVSDDDFLKEVGSTKGGLTRPAQTGRTVPSGQVITGEIIDKPTSGRKEGDTNIPDSIRAMIGEEALLNGRESALKLAADFGISPSSVAAYTNGATSTASYDKPSPTITSVISAARSRAIKRASKTLNGALNSITQEKLDNLDADKLSGVAKDMSVIIKNLEPKNPESDPTAKTGPQFVIFAPQFRDERSYDKITVVE